MKNFLLIAFLVCSVSFGSPAAYGQTDDIRQATGLPIPIGAPVIYGQVNVRNLKSGDRRPTINVSLLISGGIVERRPTNDQGYYYFLKSPADGAIVVFELDNNEVGRVVISPAISNTARRDIEIDYNAVRAGLSAPGVVSAKGSYIRSADAEKAFEAAMTAARAKKADEAVVLFRQITEKDPKDFVAFTELGTLYFSGSKLEDAARAYDQALALKADFLPAQLNLGKLHMSQKRFEAAIPVLLGAAAAHTDSADVFHYLGESYLQAKQGSKAVVALNEAIRLAPVAKAEIHLRLATLYNAAGAKDRAVNEYKQFLSKVPDYSKKAEIERYIRENSK